MRKKDEATKKKEGTARKDRRVKLKTSALIRVPNPAFKLTEAGKIHFKRICKHLIAQKALYEIDVIVVSMLAQSLSMYGEVLEKVNNPGGMIQKYQGGARNVSPEYSVLTAQAKVILDYSKLLGLDPKSRVNLPEIFAEVEEEKDPIEKLLSE